MNIGEKLIKLRREKHVSQEKLAEKLGITRQTLSNWESNITSPDLNYAKMLSEIFDVSLDEFLSGDKELKIEKYNGLKTAEGKIKCIDCDIETLSYEDEIKKTIVK